MREYNFAKRLLALVGTAALLAPVACERDETPSCDGDPVEITRPGFWEVGSHCRGVEPQYGRVFDDSYVHRFDITVSPENYQAMDANLSTITSQAGGVVDLDDLDDPIWTPVDVRHDGELWTDVGMRWKGHSSLVGAYANGVRKLSFLLTFDTFEESHPEILDQRFFGFKKLIFANGYLDGSFIREKVASEIFRAAGIPVYRMAFTEVYLDRGAGPEYLGLYTVMEDPSDKMLETQFGTYYDNDGDDLVGNLYKPHGDAARWRDPNEEVDVEVDIDVEGDAGVTVTGTVPANEQWWQEDIEAHFEKCTNEGTSDWSDVMRLIGKLHPSCDSGEGCSDETAPEQWRADLEEAFDVESFLTTLAVSAAIMNWDSYGCMHHNYYLYANPLDHGRFVWLPWDLGETMTDRQDPSCPDLDGVMFDEIVNPVDGSGIDTYWPLVQLLLADDVYRQEYEDALRMVLDGPLAQDAVFAMIDAYHALVAPYVVGPAAVEDYPFTTCVPANTCAEFETSVDTLKAHVEARRAAVEAALAAE
jgi:spore coat protein H